MKINLFAAIPEIFVATMLIFMLLIDAFIVAKQKKGFNTLWTIITLIGALFLQLYVYNPFNVQFAFNNLFILDKLAQEVKLIIYIIGVVIVLYMKRYVTNKSLLKGEFYAVYLFAILGMLVMISADNMLILYVGLELLSLSLYGLVAIDRDNRRAVEAAMKLFILSSLSSGIILYGISFIYGATNGSLQLEVIFSVILKMMDNSTSNPALIFGLVFIVAGLAFKLGLVPFHAWIPDVYEGANLAVTMIIGTITELASVIFIIRFLIEGLAGLGNQWSVMLAILAFLSLLIGNIVAISQTNIKRMLGYSTIAHMGYIAFGLMTMSIDGIASVIFYIVTYILTILVAFGVLLLLSRSDYECEQIADLKGMSKSHPLCAAILLITMFSLAGIPPMIGFYAKFKILQSLIALGFIKSAVYVVVMSLIGAFFYLRIVKVMYFDEDSGIKLEVDGCILTKSVLLLNVFVILILGVMPEYLMNYCLKLITQ